MTDESLSPKPFSQEEEDDWDRIMDGVVEDEAQQTYSVQDLVKVTGLSIWTVKKIIAAQKPVVVEKRDRFLRYGGAFLHLLQTDHSPYSSMEPPVSLEEPQELRGKFEALQQQLKKTEEALETLTTVQGAFEIKTTRVVKALIAAQKLGDTKSL